MIKRDIEEVCRGLFKQYPVVTITGPRQAGKTTLARMAFPELGYINLEDPSTRRRAVDDPKGLLAQFDQGVILDEIQRVPDLPSYLQPIIDQRNCPGQYILTGSHQFQISASISQSLAGRTAIVKLLPFSMHELTQQKKPAGINPLIFSGFYPRLHAHALAPTTFYGSYFETYVERDLRQLSQIDNLPAFERLMQLLAGRVGQLLNYNSLAADLGVSQPTIKKWLSLLQASYIIFLLPPYFTNIRKRLIKTPKIYFYDCGLAAYLLQIEAEQQIQSHPLRGNLFENMVIMEILKYRFNQGKGSNLYFYRERSGAEVDLVLQHADKLQPVEIKSAATWHPDQAQNLAAFKGNFEKEVLNPLVIFGGEESFENKGIRYVTWRQLSEGIAHFF